jgi:LmbE family N-acetylglucosaminyl deacetylase
MLAAGALATGRARPEPGPLALPRHPRVLVFAPHPDDEVLGAAGLITRLVRRGAPVRVVFVTNGDGWPWAVEEDLEVKKPADSDYLALGEIRQREALAATRRLGLVRHDVSFLGFPDGGLGELWRAHWSRTRPYTSPYTKEDSPPYPGAVNPDVTYDGQDLTSVITRILLEFRPNVIVIPHPYDGHPDHEHTSYFVIEALDALQTRHELPPNVAVLTYLVHNPFWPPQPRAAFDTMPPPPRSRIPDTVWEQIELDRAERAAKDAALREYRTQLEASPDLLRRFLRRNEIFGRVKSRVFGHIAAVH